jgi:hypothetical protein
MNNPLIILPDQAAEVLVSATGLACQQINAFASEVFRTRGGRVGSGMGTLLEALWGYYVNRTLLEHGPFAGKIEIAWLADHEYNDFACLVTDQLWNARLKEGELLRIEAKSMNMGADESKGHFDELYNNLGEWDLLLVLVWGWKAVDEYRVSPQINDYFIGNARSIALLRDQLHIARGGTFVDRNNCPDGEPLNASGKRERLWGPESLRPSAKVSYAANFGGLVRMLKTNSDSARIVIRKIRAENDDVHRYISFIHRNYPNEERNQYRQSEWTLVANQLGLVTTGLSADLIYSQIRAQPNYQDTLRSLFYSTP